MKKSNRFGVAVVLGVFFALPALGADPSPTPQVKKHPQMTVEQRKKMADVHEKMAACLRSDRALSDCRTEMMKGCHEVMGESGCPMMGGSGMGMHHHMMEGSGG